MKVNNKKTFSVSSATVIYTIMVCLALYHCTHVRVDSVSPERDSRPRSANNRLSCVWETR